jgi:sugar phosphate isomerase/epimerase
MDWVTFFLPLFGTVVGGLLTLIAQASADKRRGREIEATESRAAAREVVREERLAVAHLLKTVGDDVSAFRSRIAPAVSEESNLELAEALHAEVATVSAAYDAAQPRIAMVSHKATRDAAADVYEAWGAYCADYSAALVNEVELEQAASQKALDSPGVLYRTARGYLDTLEARASNVAQMQRA